MNYICSSCYHKQSSDFWECPKCGEEQIYEYNRHMSTVIFTDKTIEKDTQDKLIHNYT